MFLLSKVMIYLCYPRSWYICVIQGHDIFVLSKVMIYLCYPRYGHDIFVLSKVSS